MTWHATNVSLMIIIFFFYLSWHFYIIKIWVGMSRQTFLILKKKSLTTSAFFIQRLTTRTILIQNWKVEDQFDTVKRLKTNFDTNAKCWGPNQYLNLFYIFFLMTSISRCIVSNVCYPLEFKYKQLRSEIMYKNI